VHGVNDVRQREMHTIEPLVSHPSDFGVEIAISEFRRYKSSGIYRISEEWIQEGSVEIHELNIPIYNTEDMSYQWSESVVSSICKTGDKTGC